MNKNLLLLILASACFVSCRHVANDYTVVRDENGPTLLFFHESKSDKVARDSCVVNGKVVFGSAGASLDYVNVMVTTYDMDAAAAGKKIRSKKSSVLSSDCFEMVVDTGICDIRIYGLDLDKALNLNGVHCKGGSTVTIVVQMELVKI